MATASEFRDQGDFLAKDSELARQIRAFDWAATPLGPIEQWSPTVRTIVATIMQSPLPMATLWGETGVLLYNQGYADFSGVRHPHVLGMPVVEAWPEARPFNERVLRTVFVAGEVLTMKEQPFVLDRIGAAAETWLDLDYSPILDENGTRVGVLAILSDVTARVESDRRAIDERNRLWQMYEQSPSFKALLEGPDHRFVMVNEAYQQLVGTRDLIGKSVREIVPEAEGQGYFELLDRAYRSGEALTLRGTRFMVQHDADGELQERFLDFVYQPIKDDDGRVTGIFVDGADVTEQIRARDAIQASEQQFRILAQALPNHVWTSPPDGQLDWFNDRVSDYGGLPTDQMVGEGWATMVHPEDAAGAQAAWSHALSTGENYEVEFRIKRSDGEYRWHLVRALPIVGPDGQISRWIGTNTDIHDQKLNEVQTTRDRDRLWALSQDLMLICDFEGHVTLVNPSARRLLGYDPEEMIGRSLAEFLHPDDVPATSAELGKLSAGATTLAFENRYRSKDGQYRLIDWTAVPDADRIHAVGRDITEERKLARDRERIWTLSPVVKVVAELSGTVLAVNPSWTKTLGWTAEETVGRNILDFLLPAERHGGEQRLRLLATTTQKMVESKSILVAKDESERHFAWTTVPENGVLYIFGRDITAEVEAAETLASTEEALRQSQKMEAVGQLTGGIAHDFNNLLQGITGSLEIVQRRIAQGRLDDIDRFITGATGAAHRAASLTHRLLAFSRRQPLDPRAVEVNPLLSSMEDLLRRTIGERIDLSFAPEEGLWLTRCDPNQLENALLNLVINARDAMPDGGRLIIETCNTHLDDAAAARKEGIRAGQYVCVCVSDTGVGMSAETLAKAFEPFFTTKPIGQGTGLGLSMIYGFARQSDGFATIYSELGQGTTFKLYLPRFRGEADPDPDEPSPARAEQSDGETVLVVEDDAVVREMIVEVLSELGYRAIEAVDGPGGVEILRSSQRIDLLITDIGLPGLNGRQVADIGRKARPGLKILFMTGYAENAALASGFLEKGMSMITKPFAIDTLASRIRAVLQG